MKSELEQFIENNQQGFDTRVPDPAVLERLQKQLQQLDAGKKKQALIIPMKMVRWAAAACLILIAGSVAFLMMQKEPVKQITAAATVTEKPIVKSATVDAPVKNELQPVIINTSAVDNELSARKQVLFAKLENMESPGDRINAASKAAELKSVGHDIVDALVNTMDTDPSTNVRLAALDGLSKFYREPYVKKKLVASLQKQKDPMVQIGLIEILTKMREASILSELDKIVKDANTIDAVKDHAYASIFTLRS